MSATDRIAHAALAVVAALDSLHALRKMARCEAFEPDIDGDGGTPRCWDFGGTPRCWDFGGDQEPSEDWCLPCHERHLRRHEVRIAKDARRKAMARLLRAARAVRRELYVGLPGERKRCVALTAARKRQCPRLVAPGQEVCAQHAAVLSRLLGAAS